MKVTIDIDCTPEEARRFLGFPDLGPVHDIYIDRLRSAITEGISPDLIATMVKNWGPMSESGFKLWSDLFTQGGKK